MGGVARILSFFRTERNGIPVSDVTLDSGGGPNITGEHFADAGDDSFPLNTDKAVTTDIRRDGGEVPVGYLDTINIPKAEAGEKRIYGRDPNTGAVVNEIWLKADGEIEVSNIAGSITLKPTGEIEVLASTLINMVAPQIQLISPQVFLGDTLGEELVTKTFLFSIFNPHTHPPNMQTPSPQASASDHTVKTKGS